jgi:hypothetical protein
LEGHGAGAGDLVTRRPGGVGEDGGKRDEGLVFVAGADGESGLDGGQLETIQNLESWTYKSKEVVEVAVRFNEENLWRR